MTSIAYKYCIWFLKYHAFEIVRYQYLADEVNFLWPALLSRNIKWIVQNDNSADYM